MKRCKGEDVYWVEEKKMFGKPLFAVQKGYWTKPVIQTTSKKKAENFKDDQNAHIYLVSRIKDRKFLMNTTKKVGLKKKELEGYSNASLIGEITNSDKFKNIRGKLAEKICTLSYHISSS